MKNGEERDWADVREHAIAQFGGETPGRELEQEIIDEFVRDPERVIRAINRIAKQQDKIHSPWAVTRSDLRRTAEAHITASTTASRQALIDRARTWIQHAGLYHQTWDEAATELFGDGTMTPELAYLEDLEQTTRDRPGRYLYDALLKASITRTAEHGPTEVPPNTHAQLYTLRNDDNARDILHAEWIKNRPRGIQAEADHEAWNRTVAAKRQEDECQTPAPSASSSKPTRDASASPSSTPNSDSPPSASDNAGGANSDSTSNAGDSSVTSSDADPIPHFTPTGASA